MSTINSIIAYKIKQKRKEVGITGVEMAHSLGISQQHYSRIENGYTKITVEYLFSIAFVLNIKPQGLLPNYSFTNKKAIMKAKQILSAETILATKK